MLGYAIAGDDVNGDGRADIAIGAPMAGAPGKSGGGAVYVIFGSASPQNVNTTALSGAAFTNDPNNPNPGWPTTLGSRYEGFQVDAHMGMSLAGLPDVNGDGYEDLVVGAPDASLHRPGGGGVAVLYGKPQGVHVTLNDLWENGYPYFFHVDFPELDNQHIGTSVASVGDMTGDGQPDIAIGAPQSDLNGRADSGSVWIISAHLPPIVGCTQASPAGICPWIKLNSLAAAQGYRIDGAAAGDQLGSSLAGVGDQNGDGIRDLAIGASAASPNGRAGAGRVVVVGGQSNSVTHDLAVAGPLQTIDGPAAGAGLGAALAAAGDVDGDGRVDILAGAPGEASSAGAAYLVRGVPGTTSDLALAVLQDRPGRSRLHDRQLARRRPLARRCRGRRAGGRAGRQRQRRLVRGRRQRHAHPASAGRLAPAADAACAAARATRAAARPARAAPDGHDDDCHAVGHRDHDDPDGHGHDDSAPVAKPVVKKKKKLPLCPLKKPKPRYHIVKGKRVKVKPKPCRPRPKAKATTKKS